MAIWQVQLISKLGLIWEQIPIVGIWIWDVASLPSSFDFGVGGQSYSNVLAATVSDWDGGHHKGSPTTPLYTTPNQGSSSIEYVGPTWGHLKGNRRWGVVKAGGVEEPNESEALEAV